MIATARAGLFVLATASLMHATQVLADDAEPEGLGALTFTSGSARLPRAQMNRVKGIAAWHANNPNSVLVIEGFAGRGGSLNRNLRLAQDRTESVRDALIMAGADRVRMVLIAHPDAEPRAGSPKVHVRGMREFMELASEQRDPDIGGDARAARRSTPRRDTATPRGRAGVSAGGNGDAGTADTTSRAGNTIVVLPNGGASAGASGEVRSGGSPGAPVGGTFGATGDLSNAGGAERTSGGNGTSAQTGLGFDPTDDFSGPMRR